MIKYKYKISTKIKMLKSENDPCRFKCNSLNYLNFSEKVHSIEKIKRSEYTDWISRNFNLLEDCTCHCIQLFPFIKL